ncbi:MAG: N-6 DNA methylase [Gammaproteobacteria bacterium]|nr:N-6 DNA methylase [Gammaproteobacteria bacterium]
MLNSETKRSIDAARQVLVGQVPDPKGQVEQITMALLYKFMDALDKESIENGGKASFFVGNYKPLAWSQLMSEALEATERLTLYRKGIEGMAENKNLPDTFRGIFKGAFLSFNDPRTLRLFLTEVDSIQYSHSEDLGDAFEYLLSVLGSQGDAGQFRTPRHIIDFIVEVVSPKKNERILDPACGTAGFLISAQRYIYREGSSNGKSLGDQLTPREKTKLAKNIVGYDISPDMVRLSLANMYLHGLKQPQVREYDTLTSDAYWEEDFDVILANPPFMTPKGGIKPHKRFSVSANRSEVLFVDYIAEHLTLKGRAGIIVPEGIIFQSARAPKALRKNLVENWGLYAVVSLPAGVFNPYSGVKTSILLIDKKFAKETGEILFVKVENDGFNLGAQRRSIDKNDLPAVLDIFQNWKNGRKKKDKKALWIGKEKIAEDGDYNLTGERYREVEIYKNQKWQMVELGEVCEVKRGNSITKKQITTGDIPVIAGGQHPAYFHNESNRTGRTITVSGSGAYAGFVNFFDGPIFASDCSTIQSDSDRVNILFVYYFLKDKQETIYSLRSGMAQPHVYPKDIAKIKIPLPPLEIQKEIAGQIEVKRNAINHAKEVIKNLEGERRYFGREIDKLEGVEWMELGELAEYVNGFAFKPKDWKQSGKKIIRIQNLTKTSEEYNFTDRSDIPEKYIVRRGDLLISWSATIGFYLWDDEDAYLNQHIFKVVLSDKVLKEYLYYSKNKIVKEIIGNVHGNTMQHITKGRFEKIKIPLPPLEVQKQLVAEADKEEEIIAANHRLIELMENKIQSVLKDI